MLRLGDKGAPVEDLHLELERAGISIRAVDRSTFTRETEDAVRHFQQSRGLESDGVAGPQTWAALVEARHRLGDRLIYRQHPMLRGDDIAELQTRLGGLGFDAGRVDGIFGRDTGAALAEFQRNVGLSADAICGPDTVAALLRLGGRATQAHVALVRERERLMTTRRELADCRIAVGEFGGLDGIAIAVSRGLQSAGAGVDTLHHPDGSFQARIANDLGADVYLGLATEPQTVGRISFFATETFESAGGHRLAEVLAETLGSQLDIAVTVEGQRLPVLKETRMPAVLLRLGPPSLLVEHPDTLTRCLVAALVGWTAEPVS